MSIAYDNSQEYDVAASGTSTSQSFSYAVGAGNNSILTVFITSVCFGLPSDPISSVTYNGTSLVQFSTSSSVISGASRKYELWYLVAPSSGTHNIVVNLNNTGNDRTSGSILWAASYSGVDQTTPYEQSGNSLLSFETHGTSVTALSSVNISTSHDNAWIQAWYYDRAVPRATYTAATGTIRSSFNSASDGTLSVAYMDNGPKTPTGSYGTSVTTNNAGNMQSFTGSLIPAIPQTTAGGAFLLNFV